MLAEMPRRAAAPAKLPLSTTLVKTRKFSNRSMGNQERLLSYNAHCMLFSPHYQKFLTFQGKRGTHVIRRPTGCGPAQASRRCNMPSAGKTILLCLALLLAERAAAAQVPGPQTGALPPADV